MAITIQYPAIAYTYSGTMRRKGMESSRTYPICTQSCVLSDMRRYPPPRMVPDDRGRKSTLAGVAVSAVHITRDLRRPDGTGWQQGIKDGWHVAREFARKVLAYDAETMTFTFAPSPAEPGPWCYNVTGFTNCPDWPAHPDFDGNCGHVERADGTTSPVRMFGRKLFVTPLGTENWSH